MDANNVRKTICDLEQSPSRVFIGVSRLNHYALDSLRDLIAYTALPRLRHKDMTGEQIDRFNHSPFSRRALFSACLSQIVSQSIHDSTATTRHSARKWLQSTRAGHEHFQ